MGSSGFEIDGFADDRVNAVLLGHLSDHRQPDNVHSGRERTEQFVSRMAGICLNIPKLQRHARIVCKMVPRWLMMDPSANATYGVRGGEILTGISPTGKQHEP